RPCDPVNMRTTPQLVCYRLRDDRRARTSTAAPSWFYPTLVPTPELACHPHVVSQPPSRDVATLRPAAQVVGWIHQPTPPGWSDPTPRLREHRSATADREEDDRHYVVHNITLIMLGSPLCCDVGEMAHEYCVLRI